MWRFLDGPIVVIVIYRVGTIYGTLPDIIISAVSYSGVAIFFFPPIEDLMYLFVSHRAMESSDRKFL